MNNKEIPYGFCQCGCGLKTNLIPDNGKVRRSLVGTPRRFVFGHAHIGKIGKLSHSWSGGRHKTKQGYIKVMVSSRIYKPEHKVIAEKVLGKKLPIKAVVHHVNGIKDDNRNENLVICQDEAYHQLLHKRMRALSACGNPDYLKCNFCKKYDSPDNIIVRGNSSSFHQKCYNDYLKEHAKRKVGDASQQTRTKK